MVTAQLQDEIAGGQSFEIDVKEINVNKNNSVDRATYRHFPVMVALVATAGVALSAPALADPVSGQVGIASEYIGKGLGKSDEDPALFGSVRWESGGAYVTGFASQATSSRGADAEVIVATGYAGAVSGWSLDGQVMYRYQVGETNGVDSGYYEFQGDVSRKLTDKLSGRFRVNYSPDTYAGGDEAWWTEAQATVTLTPKDKLSVAYGWRQVDNGADYDAWNIGVKHSFTSAIAGDLRWYDTDSEELGSRFEGRLVASVAYSF
jgi:uncharacterized protein (TIGR02001 family)